MGLKIESFHAFVSVDENGDEGLIGMNMGGSWMPFVAADAERIESLRPAAIQISKLTGMEVRLLKFSVREDLGVVK